MLHLLHSTLLVGHDKTQLLFDLDQEFRTEDHTLVSTSIGLVHIVDGTRVDVRVVGADISGHGPPQFDPILPYDRPVDLHDGIHVNRALEVDVVAHHRTVRASKLNYAVEVCNGRHQVNHT